LLSRLRIKREATAPMIEAPRSQAESIKNAPANAATEMNASSKADEEDFLFR
jgi:hypothetical protein